jgi:hypothetical protein
MGVYLTGVHLVHVLECLMSVYLTGMFLMACIF